MTLTASSSGPPRLLVALAMALVVCACQPAPIEAVAPRAHDGTVILAVAPPRALLTVGPYTRADIAHVLVTLYGLAGGVETQVDSVDLPEPELDRQLTFTGLAAKTRYRVRATAYRRAGTAAADRISVDGRSQLEFAIADETQPSFQRVPLRLMSVEPPVITNFTGPIATSSLTGVVATPDGRLYLADPYVKVIREVDASGAVSILAGNSGQSGTADGVGAAAEFMNPKGLALDGAGNVYVADAGANNIRKITPAGVTTTVAGSTSGVSGFADGVASGAALFTSPQDVAVAPDGSLYVADAGSDRVRRIAPDGMVTTLAGDGSFGWQDGPASQAVFADLRCLEVDASGVVYVGENNATASGDRGAVRRIENGFVTTLIGPGNVTLGSQSAGEGLAQLNIVNDMALDGAGNLYVAGVSNVFRRDRRGVVSVVAGFDPAGAPMGFGGNPPALAARPFGPLFVVRTSPSYHVDRLQ